MHTEINVPYIDPNLSTIDETIRQHYNILYFTTHTYKHTHTYIYIAHQYG